MPRQQLIGLNFFDGWSTAFKSQPCLSEDDIQIWMSGIGLYLGQNRKGS
jgi:hypothetical protein